MTPIDRFERQLPMALTDLAVPRSPDYLTDILGRTAATRQRPAWASIERWLPMQLASSRTPLARMPWRQLGVLALLAVVLAAVGVYVGSQQQQQRPLPAPFGPAANGSILFAEDGDIYAADPETGETKAIVTGPENDVDPVYSLDGSRVLFGRTADNDQSRRLLFVGRDDGSGLIQVTREPVRGLTGWSFSPDGRSIVAFATGDEGPAIVVVPSDGSSQPKSYAVFATPDDGPPQYRPNGSEVMFIGKEPAAASRGVYGLDPATGAVRAIVPPRPTPYDIFGASWSPDGSRIAYNIHDASSDSITARTRVVAVDGTGDVAIDTHPESIADASFAYAWSNDGTRMIITRYFSDDGSIPPRSAIVPIDRSSAGIEIACPPGAPTNDCSANWSWSPDDSVLLGTFEIPGKGTSQILADPTTGQVRSAPWTASEHPAWQRMAP